MPILLLSPLLLLMPPRVFLVVPRKKKGVKIKGASSRAGKEEGRPKDTKLILVVFVDVSARWL